MWLSACSCQGDGWCNRNEKPVEATTEFEDRSIGRTAQLKLGIVDEEIWHNPYPESYHEDAFSSALHGLSNECTNLDDVALLSHEQKTVSNECTNFDDVALLSHEQKTVDVLNSMSSVQAILGDDMSSGDSSGQERCLHSCSFAPSSTQAASKFSPESSPLLFSCSGRTGCSSCFCNRSGQKDKDTFALPRLLGPGLQYDMWVMPVMTLLELEVMEPHQVLITKGLILRWRPVMQGRIIFVSHQWLGFSMPDPDGAHLRTLQRVLTRLMNGNIAEVSIDSRRREFSNALRVKAADWVAALPHMYVWLDYFSMPQVSVSVPSDSVSIPISHGSSSGETWNKAESLSVSTAIKIADAAGHPPGPSMLLSSRPMSVHPLRTSHLAESSIVISDHRYQDSDSAKDLQRAVSSIPAYVQLSSLMLVLVPMCRHHETGLAADYSTWRERGWCRMELSAACLAPHKLPMMAAFGAEKDPIFLDAQHASLLPPGEGAFSCCAVNHTSEGKTIPCDKEKILPVMEVLLNCKIDQLEQDGFFETKCLLASIWKRFLSGLPGVEHNFKSPSSVESMKALLGYGQQQAFPLTSSSQHRFLLQLALQFDSIATVREILNTSKINLNSYGFEELSFGLPELPMLSIAMAWSSPDLVRDILDRRADPEIKAKKGWLMAGMNSFAVGVMMGKTENVRLWLEYFPKWDVKATFHQGRVPLLHVAAGFSPRAGPVMTRILIHARADVSARGSEGTTPLCVACITSISQPEVLCELMSSGADVNADAVPQTRAYKSLSWFRRKMCKSSMKAALREGSTPLHFAAQHGMLVHAEVLVKARADVTRRNAMGLTPLDVATWMFHEVPQPLLELLG